MRARSKARHAACRQMKAQMRGRKWARGGHHRGGQADGQAGGVPADRRTRRDALQAFFGNRPGARAAPGCPGRTGSVLPSLQQPGDSHTPPTAAAPRAVEVEAACQRTGRRASGGNDAAHHG